MKACKSNVYFAVTQPVGQFTLIPFADFEMDIRVFLLKVDNNLWQPVNCRTDVSADFNCTFFGSLQERNLLIQGFICGKERTNRREEIFCLLC